MNRVEQLLGAFGVELSGTKRLDLGRGWECRGASRGGGSIPIILVYSGPACVSDIKDAMNGDYIVLYPQRNMLLLSVSKISHVAVIESDEEYGRIRAILKKHGLDEDVGRASYRAKLVGAMREMPLPMKDFENRGVFSSHYLGTRLWEDVGRDIMPEIKSVSDALSRGAGPEGMLRALGWSIRHLDKNRIIRTRNASVLLTEQEDMSAHTADDLPPSYRAVAELGGREWVILTNGTVWRLYTSRVSASATSYFEVNAGREESATIRYLVAIFGAESYAGRGEIPIGRFFEESRIKARALEDEMRSKIMASDGLFITMIKGVLDHDMKKQFSYDDLDNACRTALELMYRVWFILYAESRNLLPVRHTKYRSISLHSLHGLLDSYEADPMGTGCWKHLLRLFAKMRDGSPGYNIPRHGGDLFRSSPEIDGIFVKNRFLAGALRMLFETDGEPVDHSSLSVRHLGDIYESLLEFGVRQADRDIVLVEDIGGVREVEEGTESADGESYKKNDLYLVSRGGMASRKSDAVFYTPDEIVVFLVRRGLTPIFAERAARISGEIQRYRKSPSRENRRACLETLLDIRVLDPAMGSGHFLVEALNQITRWATEMLCTHPEHPLLEIMDMDRDTLLEEQRRRGITPNEGPLGYDVLLKRRLMERCIFGVDINPLAVELSRLSLWLDSFAAGVPLTRINHHIKLGDSTVGAWLDEIPAKSDHSIDEWLGDSGDDDYLLPRTEYDTDAAARGNLDDGSEDPKLAGRLHSLRLMLDGIAASRMDDSLLPVQGRKGFLIRVANIEDDDRGVAEVRRRIAGLSSKHGFFHWELEMTDVFAGSRRGFDLVMGNPPWEVVRVSDNEFFTRHDPAFRYIQTLVLKQKRMRELLKASPALRAAYEEYTATIKEKRKFYLDYLMQGKRHRDLWMLVLERVLDLTNEGGVISMLLPSQFLSGIGPTAMRKKILEKDILSLYVFENTARIFPIDARYRFVLLTFRNSSGRSRSFPAAFWLKDVGSLSGSTEKEKFVKLDKKMIRAISPGMMLIPEPRWNESGVLMKLYSNPVLCHAGRSRISMFGEFNTFLHSDIFEKDKNGWPLLEGKSIHQFNHRFSPTRLAIKESVGLAMMEKRRVLMGRYREIYDSFRLVFRDISGPTNMRSVLSAIIPPRTFCAEGLRCIMFSRGGTPELGDGTNKRIAYMCGILNSMPFDFAARTMMQLHASTVILNVPVPKEPCYVGEITRCAAMLCAGSTEFEPFSESVLGSGQNRLLGPRERIETTARLDAMAAHAYGISREEYRIILDSFKFKDSPSLMDEYMVDWSDNNVLRRFYGDVRRLAMPYFEEMAPVRAFTPQSE